jgi:hypothetical protein
LTIPCVTIASGDCFFCIYGLVDSQVECSNTIAVISSSSGVGVVSTLCIGLTIPIVAIACSYRLLCIYGFVDN